MDAAYLQAALRSGQDLAPAPELSDRRLWLAPNTAGNTALHLAARHGRLSLVPPELFEAEPF